METRPASADDIAQAYDERAEQAYKAALAESGPLPETEVAFRRWRNRVNRHFRKALDRLN